MAGPVFVPAVVGICAVSRKAPSPDPRFLPHQQNGIAHGPRLTKLGTVLIAVPTAPSALPRRRPRPPRARPEVGQCPERTGREGRRVPETEDEPFMPSGRTKVAGPLGFGHALQSPRLPLPFAARYGPGWEAATASGRFGVHGPGDQSGSDPDSLTGADRVRASGR